MFNNITSWLLFLVTIFTAILPDLFLKVFEEINFVNPCVRPYEKRENTNSDILKTTNHTSIKTVNSSRENRSVINPKIVQNPKKDKTSEIRLKKISDDDNAIKNSTIDYVRKKI